MCCNNDCGGCSCGCACYEYSCRVVCKNGENLIYFNDCSGSVSTVKACMAK